MTRWTDYVSPVDRASREARRQRARHWRSLRRASTHYGMADLVARALLILALLIVGTLAAGCDDGPEYIYVPVPCERDCKRPHLESGATVTDAQLAYTHALAVGSPQADDHAPWCLRVGCIGGCWSQQPRDTTRTRAKTLPRWSVQTPWPGGWPFSGGWQY